jgi:hypothetical protein
MPRAGVFTNSNGAWDDGGTALITDLLFQGAQVNALALGAHSKRPHRLLWLIFILAAPIWPSEVVSGGPLFTKPLRKADGACAETGIAGALYRANSVISLTQCTSVFHTCTDLRFSPSRTAGAHVIRCGCAAEPNVSPEGG